jgi:hypothetical protein
MNRKTGIIRGLALLSLLGSTTLMAEDELRFASGSWYDPQRNGEGFVVQVMPGDQALVTWFTYPPEGEEGQQAWLIGQGAVSGNRIVIDQMLRPAGPRFGPDFDPGAVVREHWGTLELSFSDCETASAEWSGPAAFGDGSMQLSRLSFLDDVECDPNTESEPDRVISGRSGAWFDPSHDGEGWMLELLPDGRAVVYWFTYDDQGRQAWLIGVGSLEGKTFWVDDMRLAHGTHFGAAFDASDVVLEPWGEFGFVFDDCANAKMRYASTDERFGEGTLEPVQLIRLAATSCDEPPPVAPLNSGTWRRSSDVDQPVSESASATAQGRVYTAGGFGGFTRMSSFDPDSGTHQILADTPGPRHHTMMASDGTFLYLAGGFQSKFGLEGPGSNFWRFDPDQNSWEVLTDMPRNRGGGAALYWLNRVWVAGGDGMGIEIQSYNPQTDEWSLYAGDPRLVVDHMQAVAFENELWWLGGRKSETVNTVMIWNPVTREWREGPPMIRPRAGLAAVVVQGQIMVAGGEVIDFFPGLVQSTIEVFAPGATGWVEGPAMPVPVHGSSGAEVNGVLVLVGGSDIAGDTSLNRSTQIYTP